MRNLYSHVCVSTLLPLSSPTLLFPLSPPLPLSSSLSPLPSSNPPLPSHSPLSSPPLPYPPLLSPPLLSPPLLPPLQDPDCPPLEHRDNSHLVEILREENTTLKKELERYYLRVRKLQKVCQLFLIFVIEDPLVPTSTFLLLIRRGVHYTTPPLHNISYLPHYTPSPLSPLHTPHHIPSHYTPSPPH